MKYKLKDLGEIFTGNTPSKSNAEFYKSKNIGFVKPDILIDGIINENLNVNEYISERARKKARIVQAGAIFVTCIGSIGKIGIADKELAFNQQINAILPNEKVYPKYLAYCMLQNKKKLQAIANAPIVPIINKSQFGEIDIEIEENKEKQFQIIEILEEVSSAIEKRRKQLQQMDKLVESRFIEMFGDPLSNSKGWQCTKITDVCRAIFGGGTPSKSHPEYFTGTIPWVSPKDMKSFVISDSIDHITEEAIAHSTTNLVPAHSVLMVIRSGILKHTLPVAINSIPVTINQDMKAFVPNNVITPAFLLHFFKAIESDVLAGVRSVTADNIDFKAFKKRMIIVPPMEVQEQFADFVTQTDKSKIAIQKALDETQLLFDSLMQKYFG